MEAYIAENVGDMLYDPILQRTDLQLTIPEAESPDVVSFTRSFNISYTYIISMTSFLKTLTSRTSEIRGTDQMVYPEWDGGETPLVNALWESDNLTQTFSNVLQPHEPDTQHSHQQSGVPGGNRRHAEVGDPC